MVKFMFNLQDIVVRYTIVCLLRTGNVLLEKNGFQRITKQAGTTIHYKRIINVIVRCDTPTKDDTRKAIVTSNNGECMELTRAAVETMNSCGHTERGFAPNHRRNLWGSGDVRNGKKVTQSTYLRRTISANAKTVEEVGFSHYQAQWFSVIRCLWPWEPGHEPADHPVVSEKTYRFI